MTTDREELERALATAPFAEIYGFLLVSIEDDSCTLRIPFRPVLERPWGHHSWPCVHGCGGRQHVVGDKGAVW